MALERGNSLLCITSVGDKTIEPFEEKKIEDKFCAGMVILKSA